MISTVLGLMFCLGYQAVAQDREVIDGRAFSFHAADNQWVEEGLDKQAPVLEKNTCIYKDWKWREIYEGKDKALTEVVGLGQSVIFWYPGPQDPDRVVFRVFRTSEYREDAKGFTVFPEGKSIDGRVFIREGSYWVEPPLSSKDKGLVDKACVHLDETWQAYEKENGVIARIVKLGPAVVFYHPDPKGGNVVRVFPTPNDLQLGRRQGIFTNGQANTPAPGKSPGGIKKGWLIGGGVAAAAVAVAAMSSSSDDDDATTTKR